MTSHAIRTLVNLKRVCAPGSSSQLVNLCVRNSLAQLWVLVLTFLN